MELVWLKLRGFRRFLDAEAQLHGHLIALVGPNEAGKSSILDALDHLNSADPVAHGDISRDVSFSPQHPVIRARFLLDDSDRASIAHLPAGEVARWFVLEKLQDGTLTGEVEPALALDLRKRQVAGSTLRRLLGTKWGKTLIDSGLEPGQQLTGLSEALEEIDLLSEDSRLLSQSMIEMLDNEGPGKLAERLAEQLRELLTKEPTETPQAEARRLLLQRRPLFLKFSQAHRDLQSEYALDSLNLDDPPIALRNLAQLANLNLHKIFQAVQVGDHAAAERPLEDANARLAEFFKQSWTQSGVAVHLSLHETRLLVMISTPAGPYTSIRERSDGLREFVALATFAEVHGYSERDLVLLIDEAETHLHYDAQADLIRVLDLQKAASSVIYTTHSAGCLPEDLGGSVRVVVRKDDIWSEVQNAFWTKGVGFDPLLLGMGASALVFGAVRRAVIAEGASHLILLPCLLREANDVKSLGYQVAPGVAEASESAIADLELQACKAAYVVDGDGGGQAHAAKLRRASIGTSRIIVLGRGIAPGVAIEDLVRKDLYVRTLNRELERSGRADRLNEEDIPASGRSIAIRKWCKARGYSEPNKVKVATAIALEARVEAPVLTPIGKKVLQSLHAKLNAYLGPERP